MSDAPKHIWPGEEELDGINMREWAGDYRYTLTSGPECDALMERARESLTTLDRSLGRRWGDSVSALRDLLAYLGEAP